MDDGVVGEDDTKGCEQDLDPRRTRRVKREVQPRNDPLVNPAWRRTHDECPVEQLVPVPVTIRPAPHVSTGGAPSLWTAPICGKSPPTSTSAIDTLASNLG